MIDQQRRITPLKRSSPGQRLTARMWNEPIDAINGLAAGVPPPSQKAFRKSGGTPTVSTRTGLWGCSTHHADPSLRLIFQIDPADMCIKRGTVEQAISANPGGIGGDRNVGWYIDGSTRRLWKITGSVWCVGGSHILPSETSSDVPRDVGGTSTVIWYVSRVYAPQGGDHAMIYRLDPEDDFRDVTRFAPPSPSGAQPAGVGGNEEVVWYSDVTTRRIFRLNPANGSYTPSDVFGLPDSRTPGAIGGNAETVFYCSVDEADPDAASILYRMRPASRGRFEVLAQQQYGRLNIKGIGG